MTLLEITITVNTPDGEYELTVKDNNANDVIAMAWYIYPNATSMVLVIVLPHRTITAM